MSRAIGRGHYASETYPIPRFFVPPPDDRLFFDFSGPSQIVLAQLDANDVVNRADILVLVPFDDPAATVQLGTPADPGLILDTSDVILSNTGQYQNMGLSYSSTPDLLILTVNSGVSVQGAALLYYAITRAH